MTIRFDEDLVRLAREMFFRVFADAETVTCYAGSLTAYAGDRLRIYETSWDYEEPEIIRSNKELKEFLVSRLDDIELEYLECSTNEENLKTAMEILGRK